MRRRDVLSLADGVAWYSNGRRYDPAPPLLQCSTPAAVFAGSCPNDEPSNCSPPLPTSQSMG